ncbi:MAG TPA: diaminopropionate ammonia-lyase [Vicinamibacterales bacterium]|nr:diaminopropionate ammonia-lyase [Vicinamibacterales bacterium]
MRAVVKSRGLVNRAARHDAAWSGLFDEPEFRQVAAFFDARPDLGPTPLVRLPVLARALGVGELLVKDESQRGGLDSFKIAGVTYALHRLEQRGAVTSATTLVCATAGNHGRAVARAGRERGLRVRVFVGRDADPSRVAAIRAEGAEVEPVDGGYEAAVASMADAATRHGWTVVSDTSWPGGDDRVPRAIMAGYTRLAAEVSQQAHPPPDIVIVQAGVGGLAAAVLSWYAYTHGPRRPFAIVCEPLGAACALESLRAGEPVTLAETRSDLAGLRCATPSRAAWPALRAADACVAIDDAWADEAVRRLAAPVTPDPAISAGLSGACGLGALLALVHDEALAPVREAAHLGPSSRVLVFNTEGAGAPRRL